jgi:alcohol dehydrogenase, propanol-preferring
VKAMRLSAPGAPLRLEELSLAPPGEHQVRLTVEACGVCRTDLHLLDGELPHIHYPLTPGHEIVGRVAAAGAAVTRFRPGDRVGVPWLAQACGVCRYCRAGQENLCERACFTGYSVDGGYAEQVLADARFCLPLPEGAPAAQLAPLLCAGLIGYRAYRAAGSGTDLGLYGFGAAAHLLAQVARAQGRRVFAFTKPGDHAGQAFARELGAVWAGDSDQPAPEPLDAAILFAPVGALVPAALAAVRPGGRVVCAGIHMSEIPQFRYELLWGERSVSSVANLTRADGEEFLDLAARIGLKPTVETFPLGQANLALERLRRGALQGAAVLVAAPGDAP